MIAHWGNYPPKFKWSAITGNYIQQCEKPLGVSLLSCFTDSPYNQPDFPWIRICRIVGFIVPRHEIWNTVIEKTSGLIYNIAVHEKQIWQDMNQRQPLNCLTRDRHEKNVALLNMFVGLWCNNTAYETLTHQIDTKKNIKQKHRQDVALEILISKKTITFTVEDGEG